MRRYFLIILILVFSVSEVALAQQSEAEVEAARAELRNQIVQQEMQIQAERIKLMNKREERQGYESASAVLKREIDRASRMIQKRSLEIEYINYDIRDKDSTIEDLDEKIEREKGGMAQLLRKTNRYGNISFVEIILGSKTFSEIFLNIDRFSAIKEALNKSFKEIYKTQEGLRNEQDDLTEVRGDQERLRIIQEMQRQEVVLDKREKDSLVNDARSDEEIYKDTIKEKQRSVTQIRAKLFELRDSNTGDISFGTMLGYAKEAGALTGVNPALILAILTVETNLGRNLGFGKWYKDMHPTRDKPVFLKIMAELGMDPDKVPISARPCSAAARRAAGPGKPCGYGWGGAMGPAQFIPSTWVMYQEKIGRATGQIPPNPWDPRTAVFANALLMKDNGADRGTRFAEHRASVRYFAGWRNAKRSEFWWYGDQVMEWRDRYVRDIKTLEN